MIVKWVPTTVCAMRHTAPDAGAERSRRVAPIGALNFEPNPY